MTTKQKILTTLWIIKHKIYVLWYISKLCKTIFIRGLKHDLSKFNKEEFEYVYKMSIIKTVFGSKEYYKLVDSNKSAKLSHCKSNRHHPEYYGDIDKMSIIDMGEMLCDWCAASKGSGAGMVNSLNINAKKYKINNKLFNSLLRDIKECNFI